MYPDTPESQASHGNLIQTFGISLNLEIEELEPLVIDPTELIFEPSNSNLKIKLKNPNLYLKDIIKDAPEEIEWNGTVQKRVYTAPYSIQIRCQGNLEKHEEIKVFAKLNGQKEEVGKLMVFKNSHYKDLEFDITPVRILRKGSESIHKNLIEEAIDRGFGDVTKPIADDLKNLESYLNKQSLNQALLKANIGTVYDVEINEDQWIEDDLIIEDKRVFKGNQLLEKFYEELQKQHKTVANKRGIIVYLAPLSHSTDGSSKGAGGYGDLGNIAAKHCVIFQTNLHHKETFAHEIAHVAGLEHSFKEHNKLTNDEVFQRNRFIIQVDKQINYMLDNEYSKDEIATFWRKYKQDFKRSREDLNVYYRNPHKFLKGQTQNLMDYYTMRNSFWKFQWIALQDDIIKFYN